MLDPDHLLVPRTPQEAGRCCQRERRPLRVVRAAPTRPPLAELIPLLVDYLYPVRMELKADVGAE